MVEYARLKKFANRNKTTMSQVVREAVTARISSGNPYISGYNQGIDDAIRLIADAQYAQMRFPSGKSFAELVADDLLTKIMKEEKDETDGTKEPVSGV